MVVEELLEFLVGEVDAQLLESVEIENLETSNIQDTNEEVAGESGGQGLVDVDTKPIEETLENSLGQGTG
jgi:hypothetical protein